MKKQLKWVLDRWTLVAGGLAVVLLLTVVLGFRIGALTRGVSQPEKQYITSTDSGIKLAHSPQFLAHKAPTYILSKLNVSRVGFYRIISAVFVPIAAVSIFYILYSWYSLRIAIMGSWLFITSSWVLHVGRLATPEATFLLLMPIIAAVVWMDNTSRRSAAIVVLCLLIGISLYVPGFIWMALVFILWQRKTFWRSIKNQPGIIKAVCGVMLALVLMPFLLSAIHTPGNLLIAAGLPDRLPTLAQLGKNALSIPEQLLFRGPNDPVRWLGRLPLLDVFSSVMLLFGIYSLRYRLKHPGTPLLVGSGILLGILIILGSLPISAVLPIVYILVAAGVAFMLHQWFAVFPRNPIARAIATTLMSVTVLLVSFHHISHYFIAWPQTPATRQVFNQSLVK